MSNTVIEESVADELAELSRRTGLIVRPFDAEAVNRLFAELERFDAGERRETFDYLKHALNETRASFGAEPIYRDE
jgi:hypothetical protein